MTSTDGSFRTPANQVERAWLDMVRIAGLRCEPSETPRECTDRLVRAGLDGDAVRELTELFERVRYGGAGATQDRNTNNRHLPQDFIP